ncbi:MAG: class II aldolase/adducin family protein [Terriglobia bacterium]|jgi:L-fuculose-phosphate aldolase
MSTITPFMHPRDEILATMERIYAYRMTTTSGGNLSIREDNGDIWITPTRVDKGTLRRDDMVLVRKDGKVEGLHPPSSEFPFHQAIYRARPELRGIVHAHPVALVAFSAIHQVPNTLLFPKAKSVCGEVAFAPYELPGSEELGLTVAGKFSQGSTCAILENHGVVTGGINLGEAFQRFETLEFVGRTIIKGRQLGKVRFLTAQEIEVADQRPTMLLDFQREDASSQEMELRKRLCEFVRRAYRQRLFISTQGTFSVRLDESSFLITPYQVDRGMLDPQDLVLIKHGRCEGGKTPSRATGNHDAIYRHHPKIHALINACPVNATAFSVTGAPLEVRTIPESYVVLRQVGRVEYGLQYQDSEALAQRCSPQQPALILENDGVLVSGADILEAYDRLEVLESTAEALIDSRSIGELAPMPDKAIRALEIAFPQM